jgi:hypothetical protein
MTTQQKADREAVAEQPAEGWSIEAARALYNIEGWGTASST